MLVQFFCFNYKWKKNSKIWKENKIITKHIYLLHISDEANYFNSKHHCQNYCFIILCIILFTFFAICGCTNKKLCTLILNIFYLTLLLKSTMCLTKWYWISASSNTCCLILLLCTIWKCARIRRYNYRIWV